MQQENAGFPLMGMLTQHLEMGALLRHMEPPVGSLLKLGQIRHMVGEDYIPVGGNHAHEAVGCIGERLLPNHQPRGIAPGQGLWQVHISCKQSHAGVHLVSHCL